MQGFGRSDFEAYFSMSEHFDKNNPLMGFSKDSKEPYLFSEKDIEKYLLLLDKFHKDIHDLQYIKQIKIYPSIKKVFNLKIGMENSRLERIGRILLKERETLADDVLSSYHRDRVANRFSPRSGYFFHLTQEFFNYLFIDKNQQNNDKKLLQKRILEYMKLCEEITSLIDSSDSAKFVPKYSFGGRHIKPERIVERASSIPIERNSATLAEKVFVQNMISLNMRFYGRPRLNTIQEIMCIPFFENQFDATTISRIRKKLQEQKNAYLAGRKVQAVSAA